MLYALLKPSSCFFSVVIFLCCWRGEDHSIKNLLLALVTTTRLLLIKLGFSANEIAFLMAFS